ncbi:hypothetical protein GSF21_10825 [Burkholderia pseudomallei]|nr:hypothetical protein [Burkholderia pseudomallei]MXQ33704.1 hypothetical protein [Burkholderia pseudomallei]
MRSKLARPPRFPGVRIGVRIEEGRPRVIPSCPIPSRLIPFGLVCRFVGPRAIANRARTRRAPSG